MPVAVAAVEDDVAVVGAASAVVAEAKPALDEEAVRAIVLKNALEATGGDEEIFADSSLMDSGQNDQIDLQDL